MGRSVRSHRILPTIAVLALALLFATLWRSPSTAAPPPMPPPTQQPDSDQDETNAALRQTDNPSALQGRIEQLGAGLHPATSTVSDAPAADHNTDPPDHPIVSPEQIPTHRTADRAPMANEHRLVPDEVIVEVADAASPQDIAALDRRNHLATVELLRSRLTGTALLRSRILDQRPVAAVIRALQADAAVISAQPNYVFALQQQVAARPKSHDAGLQYAVGKLRLSQAHQIAKGENVLIGMIDSGVDVAHPELRGAIAGTLDAIGSGAPHPHGTAVAGLIAAHARLMGSAPAARILAVRAFDSGLAKGVTFNILKGLDWLAVKGARVINLSFAGPYDPAIHRSLDGAYRNAIVLVAAAGNAGPTSPPLYPGADPHVIAVMATDADNKVFSGSNRGSYIVLAAPGVDVLVAAPDDGYQLLSGTSFSAAEVSGVVALMIERKPHMSPDAVRAALLATADALSPQPGQAGPSPRLVDAYRAIAVGGR